VSSSTDSIPPATEAVAPSDLASTRPNPVALEVMINVTGARPSGSGGSRDLFSEETTTVLVFSDGAVIRLASGVAIGQLLFVKHTKTNREVVCQVLHKRAYKPTHCYVELQFTEEKPDFWGVAFPEVKPSATELKLKEQVEAEETTADDQGHEVPRHTQEEVEKLRKELEALRQQLHDLEKQRAAEAPHAEQTPASASQPALSATQNLSSEAVPPNGSPAPEATPAPAGEQAAPWLKPPTTAPGPPRPMIGMTLPNQRKPVDKPADKTPDPAEALLPKPELDFSKMPVSQGAQEHKPPKAPPRLGVKGIALVVLSVLAILTVATAWWRHSRVSKLSPVRTPAVAQKKPASATPPQPAPEKKNNVASPPVTNPDTKAASQAVAAAARDDKPGTDAPKSIEAQTELEAKLNTVPFAGGHAQMDTPSKTTAAPPGPKLRPTIRHTQTETPSHQPLKSASNPPASEIGSTDTSLTPAKLLKAANPVYPPDAMRNYITGDVRAAAVVDATGRVTDVEVISGPQQFRAAAVEALKQYQYAPAMQGGKAVASRVVVTVKFWFNP